MSLFHKHLFYNNDFYNNPIFQTLCSLRLNRTEGSIIIIIIKYTIKGKNFYENLSINDNRIFIGNANFPLFQYACLFNRRQNYNEWTRVSGKRYEARDTNLFLKKPVPCLTLTQRNCLWSKNCVEFSTIFLIIRRSYQPISTTSLAIKQQVKRRRPSDDR